MAELGHSGGEATSKEIAPTASEAKPSSDEIWKRMLDFGFENGHLSRDSTDGSGSGGIGIVGGVQSPAKVTRLD